MRTLAHSRLITVVGLLLGVGLVGCESSTSVPEEQSPLEKPDLNLEQYSTDGPGVAYSYSDDDFEGEVSGRVTLDLPNFGAVERYSFWADTDDGEVEGQFVYRDFSNVTGDLIAETRGTVTCAAFEPDGRTVRLGGRITYSDPPIPPEFAFAVWTVVDNGGGDDDDDDDDDDRRSGSPDETTDIRGFLSEATRDFHCATGFPPAAFGMQFFGCPLLPSGLCAPRSGGIDVDIDD